jgi:hypothetical protein
MIKREKIKEAVMKLRKQSHTPYLNKTERLLAASSIVTPKIL